MRIARIDHEGAPRTALITDDEQVRRLPAAVAVLDVLGAPPDERTAIAEQAEAELPLDQVRLLAPIEPPTIRDFSVFEAHIEGIVTGEGRSVPDRWYEAPFCYFSNPHAVTGPGDPIAIPPGSHRLDLELEVAAIIGRPGRNLTVQEAGAYIAGYTIFNDWSARDHAIDEIRLGLGFCKAKDFANTLGPWIVTPDELEPFRTGNRLDLDLRASVNGRELGGDTLANMAWSFEELVTYASRGAWIRPGDVLGSGTCGSGCLFELWGRGQDWPPLGPGDVVTLAVEGIGTLTNKVIAGVEPAPLPPARPGRLRHRATVATGTAR
jgi:2-keto-4-pentenoate hydratase/2-oxohepta-3-ene-1,7-dioic acid hydratase in catechol pathway